ncbi:hypothetical protein [Vibrio sp. 1180_3]|uniref:hypothetical protein n=1 Tax=Vibrio sp. 1180_3 TaxID=2528832 RepID=UPI0024062F48|nr:hypothetical protein [Vibrio sp. 1180_3]MDF9399170.1 hypothetical protein [Vibrio sp. 1180_3]
MANHTDHQCMIKTCAAHRFSSMSNMALSTKQIIDNEVEVVHVPDGIGSNFAAWFLRIGDDFFEVIADDSQPLTLVVDKVLAYQESETAKLSMARQLWKDLGNTHVNDNDEILSKWQGFQAGTNRFEIWQWFESHFGVSIQIL